MSPGENKDLLGNYGATASTSMTPMMRQYWSIKEKYKDEVLFFRMGDFYEMFFEDAVYASKVLGIALTKRQDQVPMCGIPFHAVNNYVHPILDDGRKIAICEQLEKPEDAEGTIVRRDVVRILTPGTIFEENLLTQNDNRLIAAMASDDKGNSMIASADISTGDLWLEIGDQSSLSLLQERGAREVVFNEDLRNKKIDNYNLPVYFRRLPPESKKNDLIKKAFAVENIHVLELNSLEYDALALLLTYIYEVVPKLTVLWKKPQKEYLRKIMNIDETAIRTLEIIKSQSGEKETSLLGVLDKTITASGRRLLIQFLIKPSLDIREITMRQDAVQFALDNPGFMEAVKEKLRQVYDIERLVSHLQNQPQVRHLGNILVTLRVISSILENIETSKNLQGGIPEIIREKWQKNNFPTDLNSLLEEALFMAELPPILDERRFVRPGYNSELDEILNLGGSAGDIIMQFEKKEKERLEIPTLKVRYNKVIGYYIEISKGQADRAGTNYTRRQTLVNAERFTCEELKTLEDKILGARERIIDIQRAIFEGLVEKTLTFIQQLRYWADAAAFLDVIISFAKTAFENNYSRPEITENGELNAVSSRHPVVEHLFKEEIFVPNDIHLNNNNRHLAILTGPNMAGKSTYIRQVGLLQILAQTGSFVPAESAQVSLVDRIFTRIGAYDRLSRGESTFYVEMAECARIFQNFTPRSLILLDEIGRGTSTFDGISIARAMIEFLNDPANGRPRTLFATHYGELSSLIEADRGIIGLTVKIFEDKDKIIFLRKIIEGSADKSYGIYVAGLAGIHESIIQRAGELLKELENEGIWSKEPVFQEMKKSVRVKKEKGELPEDQLDMF